jgi:hypothetical protein
MRTGSIACGPKIGSTPNSASRDDARSERTVASQAIISRVIRSCASRPSSAIAAARRANSRASSIWLSSAARLRSSKRSAKR